jgi:hypothetical protein
MWRSMSLRYGTARSSICLGTAKPFALAWPSAFATNTLRYGSDG